MTVVERIHASGKRLYSHPYRLYVLDHEGEGAVQTVISVPKKIFKRAVRRNLVRRRIREALRLLKTEFPEMGTKDMLIVYVSTEILEYGKIVDGLRNALGKILKDPS